MPNCRSAARPHLIALLMLTLSACGSPAPTTAEAPAATPTIVAVDLGAPAMEVGSTHLYADGGVLVAVPGGIFTMGGDGFDNPVHEVNVSDYWIYKHEVTNGQFEYCVAMGQCTPPHRAANPGFGDPTRADEPMVGVTYEQAATYCGFVHARLPTEAEWEKAARGPDANLYPWGDAAPTCELANYAGCTGGTTVVNAHPMGQSHYRAFDMAGNALEWVADWYAEDYYANSPADDPAGPPSGQLRAVRSSAFNSGGDQIPSFIRSSARPETARDNLGFRCVVEHADIGYFAPFCNYPATYGTDGIGGAPSGPQTTVECPVLSIEQTATCQGSVPYTIVNFIVKSGTPAGPLVRYAPPPPWCNRLSSDLYDCRVAASQVHVLPPFIFCNRCTTTVGSDPQCPSGYSFDPASKSCVKPGAAGGSCLPGYTLGERAIPLGATAAPATEIPTASAGQCCVFSPDPAPPDEVAPAQDWVCEHQPGTNLTVCYPQFAACPPGTSFDGQQCISVEYQPFCIFETLEALSCTPGGGGGDGDGGGTGGACTPTESQCANTCLESGLGYIYEPATCDCQCNAG